MSTPIDNDPRYVIQPDGRIERWEPVQPVTPIEAQECANCLYARPYNKFKDESQSLTHKRLVYCHFNAPAKVDSASNAQSQVAPVRCDAWCGQWSLHPSFKELDQ